jgi:hypothetical protein
MQNDKKKGISHGEALVDDLIPYARNARIHTEAHINQLAGSIREFGFNIPVVVDAENTIIAGHGRVLAARKLGLEKVPIVVVSHLTETQKRAFILADNKIHDNSSFDYEMLQNELQDLMSSDFDISIAGFEDFETSSLDSSLVFDDLESGVFSGHLQSESTKFDITFTFDKEHQESFDAFFQTHKKEELTEKIIEIVKNAN